MKLKNLSMSLACGALIVSSLQSHAEFIRSTDANGAGLHTATTYGFTEAGLTGDEVVTNQYAGVIFAPNLHQSQQRCDSFNSNMTFPCLANFSGFVAGVTTPWEMIFSEVQSQAGFHLITNSGNTTLFEAYLGTNLVESISVATDLSSLDNFYGFKGISFDRIQVTTSGDAFMLLDDLTFGTKTPQEQITDLIIKLDATVVTNGTFLSGGLKTSLTASLGGALDQLDSTVGSNVAAAHGKLNAFIHKVQAQSSKQLPTTTANELIDSANAIIAQLQNGQ